MAPFRNWYTLCLILRLIVALAGDSYIHPDEYHQCGQVAASIYLSYNVTLPWEYAKNAIARSFLPVDVLCGIPFIALHLIKDLTGLATDGRAEFAVLRIWMFLLSLLSDAIFLKTAKILLPGGNDAIIALSVRSLGWTSLVMSVHSFSNVLEGICFDAMLYVLVGIRSTLQKAICGGLILALGFFVRITFPSFGFSLIIHAVIEEYTKINKKNDADTRAVLVHVFKFLALSALSFLTAATIVSALDSWRNENFVVGPLANLAYNLKSSNLAKHGIHQRWTHMVNLIMMFTFLPIVWGIKIVRDRRGLSFLDFSILLPFLVLSLFPHQEPRFLYPMLSPLSLLVGPLMVKWHLFFPYAFVNCALTVFFAFLHQGGVAAATMAAGRVCDNSSCCIVVGDVYTLPSFLLGDNWRYVHSITQLSSSNVRAHSLCNRQLLISHQSEASHVPGTKRLIMTYGYHWNAEAGGIVPLHVNEILI